MIDKQSYVARISKASPLELVIINFELILEYLRESKESLGDEKAFNMNIINARKFLTELRNSLNMKYEISYELMSLYNYVDKRISDFLFSEKLEDYDETVRILKTVMDGFLNIEEEDKSPVMTNTDSIYAGLTYGKDGRLQEFVDIKTNKGFKA